MRPFHQISDLIPLAIALAALGALAGCSTSETLARYPRGEFAGNQGGSSDVVFGGPGVQLAGGWEYARRDDALSFRTADESSNPNPPELGQLRRIFLNSQPDQIIYFEQHHAYQR